MQPARYGPSRRFLNANEGQDMGVNKQVTNSHDRKEERRRSFNYALVFVDQNEDDEEDCDADEKDCHDR